MALAASTTLAVAAPPNALTNPVTWLPNTPMYDCRTSMAAKPTVWACAVPARSTRMPALARADPLPPVDTTGPAERLPCT
ncbi:hypothetical protein D3C71_1753860 [compost metagenome]